MKKSKLKVAVIGANGRMGQEIAKALADSKFATPFLGVIRQGSCEGFEKTAKNLEDDFIKKADVWIDFSSVENTSKVLKAALVHQKPLVSGVTGLSDKQLKELQTSGKKIPILWSPNMSLGVAALKKALSVARDLEDFDFQIEEFHHRHKKDKPSGTAKYLQNELQKHVSGKIPDPLAIRGGGIFGVHKVWMMSEEEVVCFEHQALNRAVFANGAVKAAHWLSAQDKGFYGMDDLFAGAT